MTPLNTHPGSAARGLRRPFLQAASDLLTASARRSPDRARPRLEGLEDRCLLSVTITEFTLPTANANPGWITAGPDGNLWFTVGYVNGQPTNIIGMISPTTHAITEFSTPTANSAPGAITVGPDGNLWFNEFSANKIGEINPATHAITEFPLPPGKTFKGNLELHGISAGADGNIWFTESLTNQIGMINPVTHAITLFAVPTSSAGPNVITEGPDGNLWFTELDGNIGMVNPTTHAITEFPIPPTGEATYGITAGPDGDLWFTALAGDIGMINPVTHASTLFPVANNPEIAGITAGPDGKLWFAESTAGKIGMINPATHTITEFTVPYANSFPFGITTGPDGNLWFADNVNGSIGVVTLNQTSLVTTQQPPASVTAGTPFGLTVEAEDSSGNLVTSFNGMVTVALASNPGGATLGGTLTVTASAGVATFSGLTLTKAASGYTLAATSSGLGQGVTSAMTVTPSSPTQLMITQQPPGTVKVNSAFTMKASIEDPYGNVVTTASGTVGVAFASNPTGATLGGTTSVTTSQGVASFTNLTINKTGSGYTLEVSSSGLSSAITSAINVTKNGMSSALATPTTTRTPDPLLAPLVLDSPDLWDGLGFKKRSRRV